MIWGGVGSFQVGGGGWGWDGAALARGAKLGVERGGVRSQKGVCMGGRGEGEGGKGGGQRGARAHLLAFGAE